ncbi:MAG: hypothetical protein QOH12_974 [Solirubrobacteraceae bacterium]|jgi:hypothetical protein|nr:hypothetical protein [Solirubrobacteraceae bacterium]
MTRRRSSPERRAERLVRCYPRVWRARYGEEFTQLLIDDISERPRARRRTADVMRAGALARLTDAGLTGDALEPHDQVRAGLAWLGFALAGFLAAGVAIWSQLTIGWQWSAPAAPTTRAAMLLMTCGVLCLLVLLALAAVPIFWSFWRAVLRRDGRRSLACPVACTVFGAVVWILGSRHFAHRWPGTGGHPWAGSDLVPGWLAAFCWASTRWITSYWVHPAALATFSAAELAWMAASPLALLACMLGTAATLRRLALSSGVLRYETRLAAVIALAMAGFLAGAGSWVISGGPGPRGLFRVGRIDDLAVLAMTLALVLAFRAAQRAQAASGAARARD